MFALINYTMPYGVFLREIEANSSVTLAFGDTKENANLILYGEASIEKEVPLKRHYWKGEWRLFFPDGPKSDDYVVIRIEPFRMELMNFRRNIVPEPFGLRPAVLSKKDGQWVVEEVDVDAQNKTRLAG